MKTFVIATGVYKNESLEALQSMGDFRRATRNMCVAYLSMKTCVDKLSTDWQTVQENLGAVLGTSHGELSATANFLQELALSNTARPLVFQSSLHNATLGFLAKQFVIKGPTLTVSDMYRTGKEAIETAEILLSENIVKFCFVTGIDLIPEHVTDLFFKMYPDGKTPKEGAATMLLSNEEGLALLKNTKPIAELNIKDHLPSFNYDSDFIENEISHLLTR